ncbi:MAG: flagellar basal-body rod protein FlgF [Parvularculaceae bacterium]
MSNVINAVLSRQVSLERELASLANNIANASTAGYRRDTHIFSEYVNALRGEPSLSQTRIGGRAISAEQGELTATNAPFDLAIEGPGFFVVQTPEGQRLTRAGAFLRNEQGVLANADGDVLSGEGGGAIAIPNSAGAVAIADDGVVSADGEVLGQIRIVNADPTTLQREGDTRFRTDAPLIESQASIRQGFIEQSNVEPVIELARLIEVQRSFELGQQLVNREGERVERAISVIGGQS